MNVVRKYRKKNKISLQKLALKSQIHINTLWRYEKYRVIPSLETLKKISNATKIDLETLIDGE
jgi:transcriptional regulator with XRE-family HTH domain